MSPRLPDFLVIGAMKCATTTLDRQLARQRGVFMAEKELGFFAVNETFARGIPWYRSRFEAAPEDALWGETSTDYSKLPAYPEAAPRIAEVLPEAKIVYVIRHPVKRLLSHYVHGWTKGEIREGIEKAIRVHPGLVEYGLYARQLAPYLSALGPERIHLVLFERLTSDPETELLRIGRFLGAKEPFTFLGEESHANRSKDRLKRSPVRDALVFNPVSTFLRRTFVPRGIRERVKGLWQMKEPPALSAETRAALVRRFDEDLARLEGPFGVSLSCARLSEIGEGSARVGAGEAGR